MYYNGDFDPEGLVIADKLKCRYPNLELFCYDKDDYDACLSDNDISASRLKKLDKINSGELNLMKELLRTKKKTRYHEKNINKIVNYILK